MEKRRPATRSSSMLRRAASGSFSITLSVISMDWAAVLFDLQNTVNAALNMGPWDMHLGIQVWKRFEVGSYDVMGMLTKIYSGYGDVLTTPEERLNWLRNGDYVAVHQVKTAEQP